MDIEIAQNIVLIALGMVIFFMYITSKAFDSIADDMDTQENSK